MIMSHIMATSQPPPSAYPLTAAMTGFRTWPQRLPAAREVVAAIDIRERKVFHATNVRARRESPLGAGEDDDGNAVVSVERQQGIPRVRSSACR
jgi:hypothetical protein